MIVSRTPFRVSLFGGGLDHPQWFAHHGGQVIGFAIDKYCWVSVRRLPPFFDYKHRIVYSTTELVNDYADINHPAAREILRQNGPDFGVEIHHDGDLPARSGLGSSSAFTVGLLNALHAFNGQMTVKNQLAQEAIHFERQVLKEKVGVQDQIFAAYGGFNHIVMNMNGICEVAPVIMPPERLELLNASLMMFFTGFSRIASHVEEKKLAQLDKNEAAMHEMADISRQAMADMTDMDKDINWLGHWLERSWAIKRSLSDGVSSPSIDEMYEAAKGAGALGGKLLGAGGGGFMLLFVPPEMQYAVRDRLRGKIFVPFTIGAPGSRIEIYEPD